jgi:hypothetical protein
MGYFKQLGPPFNGAWPGHDNQVLSANNHPTNRENRVFGLKLAAGGFIGLGDRHDILYALHPPNLASVHDSTISNNANHGPIHADDGMYLAAGRFHPVDDGIDIFLAGLHLHHYDHAAFSSLIIWPANIFRLIA